MNQKRENDKKYEVLSECFAKWKEISMRMQRCRDMMRRRYEKTLSLCFKGWKETVRKKLEHEDHMIWSAIFFKMKLGRKILQAWKRTAREDKTTNVFRKKIAKIMVLKRLKMLVTNRKQMENSALKMTNLMKLARMFSMWKIIARKNFLKVSLLKLSTKHRIFKLLKSSMKSLHMWLEMKQKGKMIQAKGTLCLLKLVHRSWRSECKLIDFERNKSARRRQRIFETLKSFQVLRRMQYSRLSGIVASNIKERTWTHMKRVHAHNRCLITADGWYARKVLLNCLESLSLYTRALKSPKPELESNAEDVNKDNTRHGSYRSTGELYGKRSSGVDSVIKRKNLTKKERILNEWKKISDKSKLDKFKIRMSKNETRRRFIRQVFHHMIDVLKQERSMFALWTQRKLLFSAVTGWKLVVKRKRMIQDKLKAIILRRGRIVKRTTFEKWSRVLDELEEDEHDDALVKFMVSRIALRRFLLAVQASREDDIVAQVQEERDAETKNRVFSAWTSQTVSSESAVLFIKLGLRKISRIAKERKQMRAAKTYSDAIILKKSMVALQFHVHKSRRILSGLEGLTVMILRNQLTAFFCNLASFAD